MFCMPIGLSTSASVADPNSVKVYGSYLRPFWWKDVSCPIPSFIHLRYTGISQNSILLCLLSVFMSS